MPRCAWCYSIKTTDAFEQTATGWLHEVCRDCESKKLKYCGFCGMPIHDSRFYKISTRLYECMDCHEQTLATIRKNALIRTRWKLNQVIKQTKYMSENLIGNLRERLFKAMDGLEAGTMTIETAAQITDVAKTIIESAKVENEYVKLTGTAGSGFIPVSGQILKDPRQLGPAGKAGQ